GCVRSTSRSGTARPGVFGQLSDSGHPHLLRLVLRTQPRSGGGSKMRPLMRTLSALLLLLTAATLARAEVKEAVPLWPEGAPGALGKEEKDIPALTPYLPEPDKATGAALVVFPGGGYGGLAQHEGNDFALWFNQQGITAFVVKYRLGSNG